MNNIDRRIKLFLLVVLCVGIAVVFSMQVRLNQIRDAAHEKALAYQILNSVYEVSEQSKYIRNIALFNGEGFDAAGLLPNQREAEILSLLSRDVRLELFQETVQPYFVYRPIYFPLKKSAQNAFVEPKINIRMAAMVMFGVTDEACHGIGLLTRETRDITQVPVMDMVFVAPEATLRHPVAIRPIDLSMIEALEDWDNKLGRQFCLRTTDNHNAFVQILGSLK